MCETKLLWMTMVRIRLTKWVENLIRRRDDTAFYWFRLSRISEQLQPLQNTTVLSRSGSNSRWNFVDLDRDADQRQNRMVFASETFNLRICCQLLVLSVRVRIVDSIPLQHLQPTIRQLCMLSSFINPFISKWLTTSFTPAGRSARLSYRYLYLL